MIAILSNYPSLEEFETEIHTAVMMSVVVVV